MDQLKEDLPLLCLFRDVTEPRIPGRCQYALLDVLALSFCAIFSGAQCFTQIEDWADEHEEWLKETLGLCPPFPSHDTYRRVLGLIDPRELEVAFFEWARTLLIGKAGHISVDGKSIRGTEPRFSGKPLTLVSCYEHGNSLVLGQNEAPSSGLAEISAADALLDQLDLKGVIVSGDAAYSTTGFASRVRDRKGDYLLVIKNNNRPDRNELEQFFLQEPSELRKAKYEMMRTEATSHGHGRFEKRGVTVVSTRKTKLQLKDRWRDIKTVIRVERERVFDDHRFTRQVPQGHGRFRYERNADAVERIEQSTHYYISSRKLSSERAMDLIREHWGIENALHWRLDMILHEDECEVRHRAAARNLALMRKIALNLYAKDPTPGSYRSKMKRAGWNVKRLTAILQLAATQP